MPSVNCPAGHLIEGADTDDLIRQTRVHLAEAHPDLQVTDQHISDFVTAALRMRPPAGRVSSIGVPEVKPLTPELLDDYLRYFDHEAFADNPAWAACYCMFYLFRDGGGGPEGRRREWEGRSAADNRRSIAQLITEGEAHGFLAYLDGRPVGWCNAGPRSALPGFDEEYRLSADERVGSIVCFVIAPSYRRHGIARTLLDAACDGFRRQGLTHAEAYPARDATSDAAAYHGPLAMYLNAGFTKAGEREHCIVVRRPLYAAG